MLCVYACGIVIPYAVDHYVSYRSHSWGVGGGVRKAVLHNILASFLYYEEKSRDSMNTFDWIGTFNHEVHDLVKCGYMQFFLLFTAFGRILAAIAFIVYIAVTQAVEEQMGHVFLILLPFPLLPPVIYLYTSCRARETECARANVVDAKIILDTYVGQAVDHYRTIADYWSRPVVLSRTLERICDYNKTIVHIGMRRANDDAFFKWVIKAIEVSALLVGGMLASREIIQVGTFSTLFSAASSAASQFQSLFATMINMQTCYVGLWKTVEFMNVPTDLEKRKQNCESQRDQFAKLIKSKAMEDPTGITEDKVPICVKGVSFSYSCRTKAILRDVNLEIDQGSLVAIMGGNSSGKSTLMQVLADVLTPTQGQVFTPPHLRVLHVRFRERLWQRPLADTLFFGILVSKRVSRVQDLSEADKRRGLKICQRLELERWVIDHIVDGLYPDGGRPSRLSFLDEPALPGRSAAGERPLQRKLEQLHADSQVALTLAAASRFKVQLARALVTDPEVLLLHKPLSFATTHESRIIMELLQEFVNNKGIENDPATRAYRRPRTCIISLEKPFYLRRFHKVAFLRKQGDEGSTLRELDEEARNREVSLLHRMDLVDTEDGGIVAQERVPPWAQATPTQGSGAMTNLQWSSFVMPHYEADSCAEAHLPDGDRSQRTEAPDDGTETDPRFDISKIMSGMLCSSQRGAGTGE
ncbi:unnamed protein product [Prorocentrum cordatum]|uniref:ABC transporter domain-containing protein n=1 Tax=Prorocentrum cordatum TaxID=2364126 RepID=A0ABN9U878_9DINO|nr:unnamed protein product [Polarella glacialis]